MRRLFPVIVMCSVLGAVAVQAQSVKDLVGLHIEAVGGEAAIEGIESLIIQGARYTDEQTSQYKLYKKGEKKFRYELTTDGNTRVSGHDGSNFWREGETQQTGPDGGPMGRGGRGGGAGGRMGGRGGRGGRGGQMGGLDRDAMRQRMAGRGARGSRQDMASVKSPLYVAFKNGDKLKLKGKAYVDGVETYRIEGRDRNKTVTQYYIDSGSCLLLKMETVRTIRDRRISTEITFSDFQDVSGITVAHAWNQRVVTPMGERVTDTVLASLEMNVDLDDMLFVKPKK